MALERAFFQVIISRFTVSPPKPPSVVVDHNGNVVGIVEGLCTTIKGGVVKLPFRGSELRSCLVEKRTGLRKSCAL
jgi:hypothetical protein